LIALPFNGPMNFFTMGSPRRRCSHDDSWTDKAVDVTATRAPHAASTMPTTSLAPPPSRLLGARRRARAASRARRGVRGRASATTTTTTRAMATFGDLISLAKKKKKKAPAKPPAGTPAEAAALKAAALTLAVPTLATFPSTRAVLDAFDLENGDPAAFTAVAQVQHFANVVGSDCFALIALCGLYVLSDAAENARLDSATYQRVAGAIALYGAANILGVAIAATADGSPSPSAAAVAGVVAALAPASVVAASVVRTHGGGLEGFVARVKEDVALAADIGNVSEVGGYLEYYYKLSFWASIVVGGAFAFSPLSPLSIVNEYNPSSQFVQRAFGLGAVFMLAPVQFVLLDASRRGRLGGGTFKKLNLSVAAAVFGIDLMTVFTFAAASGLGPDAATYSDGSGGIYNYVGALAVSFSICAVYLYQGVAAKK